MNAMCKYLKRGGGLLLAVLLLLTALTGCASSKNTKASNALRIALAGGSFGESFLQQCNPLFAQSEQEYAAGSLLAPSIMRYEEGKGWISVLGTISSKTEDGRTVATVKLKKGLRYTNGRQASVSDYLRVVRFILRTNYTGYFEDFYTYPIEGLVACRYNCAGLTLADLPDFEKQLTDEFKEIDGEDAAKAKAAYEALLLETKICGIYDGNPETKSPDGRTFRQVLSEDLKPTPSEDYFQVEEGLYNIMLADLCSIYAAKPKAQWMVEQLKDKRLVELQKAFEEECFKKGQQVDGEIAGMQVVDNTHYATTLRVTFERVIESEDEVIRMLNLPLIYSQTSTDNQVVGLGEYLYAASTAGRKGMMVELSGTKEGSRPLFLMTMDQQDVYASLHMGQISAAAINGKADGELVEKYGLSVMEVGGNAVVYLPDRISKEELEQLKLLF
ncbi:MAG: hypothetical protein IJZ33_05250 [Clostridia bacterium]|nr:hypothetical protein [Clostridia bacterium]